MLEACAIRPGAPSLHVQYNVTVVGITKTGTRTQGKNRLQFTTPAPAVRVTSARALGPTRGTANATALPNGYFATVSQQRAVWAPCADHAPLTSSCMPSACRVPA